MEDLLARERAAEQKVQYYLKNKDEPILIVVEAFKEYRQASEASIFAGFEHAAAKKESALWLVHTQGKAYFQQTLKPLRKVENETKVVEIRQLVRVYLQFIKDSQRFYRGYIHQLNVNFGGIPELEAVAHQVRSDGSGESSQPLITPELRKRVLDSCHQTLIYLGDLSRWRASEKLDKNPDFGPAIGYYGLACTIRPSSGLGQHQLAVIALEQRQHLRAIYHLYRAMVVEDPHPNAAKNLRTELNKTNEAWDRGELIPKGLPKDPEASKRTLVGWFVRLQSMYYKGEVFRGHDELENEVVGQLAGVVKQRPLDSTLMRMVMVNLAAQFNAAEKFQVEQTQENHQAFLYFFRSNIKTFTTLLRVFYDDLRNADYGMADENDDIYLASRLTNIVRRVLPALRLYSSWILCMVHLVTGLSEEEFLKSAIDQFWAVYAKAVDLVATVFPIWDLEELSEISYMLEEDADTLGFKPLIDSKTDQVWHDKTTGALKPRFSALGVVKASPDDEDLARVKAFLVDGLYLANDDDNAPIKLRGTRILHRDAEDVEELPFVPPAQPPKTSVHTTTPASNPKPLTYAAAAAKRSVKLPTHATAANGHTSSTPVQSRHAQLSRMVDDLVDDDESNNPVTPPQHHVSSPAVVAKGDVSYSALPGSVSDFAQSPNYSYQPKQNPIGTPVAGRSPTLRTPKSAVPGTPVDRLQAVSSLWNDAHGNASSMSSHFPVGLPTGTLSSPAQFQSRGHSRVNSASSIRSKTSQNVTVGIADSWSSIDSGPRATMPGAMATPVHSHSMFEQSNMASPLLFGAGGGVWSNGPLAGARNVTPPNGQGG